MKEKITMITPEDMRTKCKIADSCRGGCNQPSETICKKCYCAECISHTCKPILPNGWGYKA